jgi:DNA-binding winged helix-turn-helix (wHTH) protein/tetratricopeptide (TPR) repeat protein
MGKRVYYFGDFCLDPLAQELSRHGQPVTLAANALQCLVYLVEHRERPVGKDELVSVVWGRVDVSDNLLAQTIVRLRRALGDVSGEQRCIKTIPRVGYRWMLDTVVAEVPGEGEAPVPAPVQDVPVQAAAGVFQRRAWSLPRLRRSLALALLLTLAVAAVYWRHVAHDRRPVHFSRAPAVVLPAEVKGPQDWKWLRLGLMELLSNDLRDAKVPVESSQAVLALLDQADAAGTSRFAAFELVIRPRVTFADNLWHVHLDATSHDGHTWQAESSSDNVMKAARSANAGLLAQIGIAVDPGKPTSDDAKDEYLMRIDAASYADAADVVRELLDKAPPTIREMPEFDYAKAVFHCNQGDYALCKQGLADLLQRLPADTQPVLRGRVLAQQYYVYFREHDYAGGEAALTEAVQLLQKQKNTTYLAFAFAERGELETVEGKWDQAQSDFGLARINYALSGHIAGALSMDESQARLSMQRGQYAQALPVIERAYDAYLRMGMRQFLAGPLQDLILSQRMLLQFRNELATTDRYWPFEQTGSDFAEQITRHALVYERAHALADNGRTVEASKLLEQLLADIERDPKGEPGLQGTAYVLLSKLALERGDIQMAESWMSKTMAGQLLEKDNDARDYADAWLIQARMMERAGKPEELKHTVASMQSWAAALPDKDAWIAIVLLRTQAIEALSEGRRDRALDQLKLAMSQADQLGVPELIVDVGQAYVQALLAAGKLEDAASISGKLSTWSQFDWRAAWAQASVYRALGQAAYAEPYLDKAKELAGDRVLPGE